MARRSLVMGMFLLSSFFVSCGTKKDFSEEDSLVPRDEQLNTDELDIQEEVSNNEQNEVIVQESNALPDLETGQAEKSATEEAVKGVNDSMGKDAANTKEASLIDIKIKEAGAILDTMDLKNVEWKDLFYSSKIDDKVKSRINGKSYGENCDVPYSDLRYVRVLHKNFEDKTQIGELIVNKSIAEDIIEIFKELYEKDYPIERMVLVDEYNADDNASMAANNSSAFNFRFIDGTKKRSSHSDGLAIDINPRYNPYVRTIEGKTVVLPENGTEYADRSIDCPYYIKKDDLCYKAFTERGFTWGGDWKNTKDYQHFQKTEAD